MRRFRFALVAGSVRPVSRSDYSGDEMKLRLISLLLATLAAQAPALALTPRLLKPIAKDIATALRQLAAQDGRW